MPSLASEVTTDPLAIALLIEQVAYLSPSHLTIGEGTDQAKLVVEQACFMPVGTSDVGGTIMPVIGVINGFPNYYIASGHSCWGISNGRS